MQPCQVVDSLWSASRGFAAVEAAPSEKGIFGIPQMGFFQIFKAIIYTVGAINIT